MYREMAVRAFKGVRMAADCHLNEQKSAFAGGGDRVFGTGLP